MLAILAMVPGALLRSGTTKKYKKEMLSTILKTVYIKCRLVVVHYAMESGFWLQQETMVKIENLDKNFIQRPSEWTGG